MPVEIGELLIRATIEAPRSPERATGGEDQEREISEIVAVCVEQVLDVLRREKER